MRFLAANDIHLSDKAPRWRQESYGDEIFAKIEWIIQYANEQEVDFVCFPGDVFHNPVPNRVSHGLVQRLLAALDSLRCPLLIAPGNHDLSAGRLESLERQPLGVIGRAPNVHILTSKIPRQFRVDGDSGPLVCGLEWRYDHDASTILELLGEQLAGAGESVPSVLFLHAAIAIRDNPFYPVLLADELAGISPLVVYGHLHPPEEPYELGGTLFINPGSVSRGSLSPSDIERMPQIADIRVNPGGIDVSYIPILAAKDPAEVFRLEAARMLSEDSAAIEEFVAELGGTTIERVNLESLINSSCALADSPKVAALCRQILESVND